MPSKYAAKLEWRGKEVEAAMNRAFTKAFHRIGTRAEEIARSIVPVITGNLQRSIYSEVQPGILILGASMFYAPFVEARKPFLWPAWEAVRGDIVGTVKIEFGNELPDYMRK